MKPPIALYTAFLYSSGALSNASFSSIVKLSKNFSVAASLPEIEPISSLKSPSLLFSSARATMSLWNSKLPKASSNFSDFANTSLIASLSMYSIKLGSTTPPFANPPIN